MSEKIVLSVTDENKSEDEPQDEGYRLDDQIGYVLRLANQRHTTIFQELSVRQLTPTQFAALVRLAEVGSCSQNHLGRLTAMDVATIKGVVDRLQAKGLVVLTVDPSDKRRTLIGLSEEGEGLVDELHRVGTEITRRTLEPLKPADQRTLLRLLKKIT